MGYGLARRRGLRSLRLSAAGSELRAWLRRGESIARHEFVLALLGYKETGVTMEQFGPGLNEVNVSRWRKMAWTCAVVLAAAEYSWLSVVGQTVPPLPRFLWPVQALLFPAAVVAMLGTVTYVGLLLYSLARRRAVGAADYVAALLCVGLTAVVLRW
jgi:hypothetical protein